LKEERGKIRLDQKLMILQPELSRNKAKAIIMSGKVEVNGKICDKPGSLIANEAKIVINDIRPAYVSRGGYKLAGALKDFSLPIKGLNVIDVGASSGGFTDCLLKHGAKTIIAVDVGYGQLDWSLRENPAVLLFERFNIRNIKREHLPLIPDLAVIDVSFISLKLVFPVIYQLGIPEIVALVKPQFEVGRKAASKGKGVIRDQQLHKTVLNDLLLYSREIGYYIMDVTYSSITGPKGNIEYFFHLALTDEDKQKFTGDTLTNLIDQKIGHTVNEAFKKHYDINQ